MVKSGCWAGQAGPGLPGWPGQASRLARPSSQADQARLPGQPGQAAKLARPEYWEARRLREHGSVGVTICVLGRGGNLRKGEAGNRHSLAAARRTAAMLRGLLLLLRETVAERTAAIAERTAAERDCARTWWLRPRSLVAPRGGWRISEIRILVFRFGSRFPRYFRLSVALHTRLPASKYINNWKAWSF